MTGSTHSGQPHLIFQFKQGLSRFLPIFGSHVLRIGFWRVILGGFTMYLSLPFFLLHQLIYLQLFGNWILPKLIPIRRIPLSDYFILDRYGIKQLPWFDRVNCLYCGYANGFAMYWDAKLEEINEVDFEQLSTLHKFILSVSIVLLIPFCLIFKFHGYLIYYRIVSNFLGLHRYSSTKQFINLRKESSKNNEHILARLFLINEIIECSRLNNNLEQIESAWCPFRHLGKYPDIVIPDHHANFLFPEQIETVRKILLEKGTFSALLPRW